MAGIGFRLEKILEGDTFIDSIRAHFYSAFICAGPWLISILTLFCMTYVIPKNIDVFELVYFRTTVVYVFAFSLITTGIFYLSLTRYLADKLYLKEKEALVPAYNTAVLLTLLLQAFIGIGVFGLSGLGFSQSFLSILIYMTISLLWLIMLFLTALRDYASISTAYLIGSFVAVAGARFLGARMGLDGYFLGYLIGHLVIVSLLSTRIYIEFQSKRIFDWNLFSFLKKHIALVLIGVFYNAAIWIDKIIFWLSPLAVTVTETMKTHPLYDSTTFYAYLTIIPALSLFLLQIETRFYKKYRFFYMKIVDKAKWSEIQRAKREMGRALSESLGYVIVCQGIISLLVITFAPEIARALSMQSIQIPMFRIIVAGAFLHSVLLLLIIIILYFDFQKLALGITLFFFASNACLTWITTFLAMPFMGYGYFFSALLSVMAAFYALDFKFRRLEYYTFALQPVAVHREEEIA